MSVDTVSSRQTEFVSCILYVCVMCMSTKGFVSTMKALNFNFKRVSPNRSLLLVSKFELIEWKCYFVSVWPSYL
jgi:hypothetical protein